MGKLRTALIFGAIAILGAVALAVIALHQGESISAVWIVVAALCVYAIAYRFYARYLAGKVMGLNAKRPTPAVRHNDGVGRLAFTSRPSRARGRWSGRCWRRRWAICPACCGFWSAPFWRARCRT